MKIMHDPTARTTVKAARTRALLLLLVAALSLLMSCSQEKNPPPQNKTVPPTPTISEKAQWADMLLRPTDSTKQYWLHEMMGWPDPLVVVLDSAGRGQLSDLTFALNIWAYKNLDFAGDSARGGLRMEVLIGATYVPTHLLMKDFSVDSVLLFLPGQDAPVGRKTMFPARRKFLQGVWQVQFAPTESATIRQDFPEGTRLKPRVFASWKSKKIIFDAPAVTYEYEKSP